MKYFFEETNEWVIEKSSLFASPTFTKHTRESDTQLLHRTEKWTDQTSLLLRSKWAEFISCRNPFAAGTAASNYKASEQELRAANIITHSYFYYWFLSFMASPDG